MINRKTKRQSPPPYKSTFATTVDQKQTTSDSFSKWSRVLQRLSPPNKKRRAFEIPGQQQERWSLDEESDSSSTRSSTDSSRSSTSSNNDQIVPSFPPVLKRERSMDQLSKQKVLNRRAMYIPNTTTIIMDGPRDAQHQWALYCATHQKLRRTTLPLLESLHLRKMLNTLQQVDDSRATGLNSIKTLNKETLINLQEDEEDDVPLGALLEKNKKPVYNTNPSKHINKKMVIPPTSSIKAFYNSRRFPSKQQFHTHKSLHSSGFPHYYSNNCTI